MYVSQLRQLLLGLALSAACILSSCSKAVAPQKEADTAPEKSQSVRYVKVVRQQMAETLELAAKVQADPTKLVHLFPPASGRVTAVRVKPGDRVARGQVVALLNSSDVAAARSDFEKARIEAQRSARALERQKLLFEHGAAAEKDYLDARALSESAHAELLRAQQRLELFHVNAASATDEVALTTPISGVVLDISAAPGEFSKSLDNANPLITVADLSSIWIVGDVYERDMEKVHPGAKAVISIQAYPDRQWQGVIGPISGALDPVTRTLKVRVAISNPDLRLRPEMFGTIQVKVGSRDALLVPAASIIREGDKATIFVKNAGKPEQRQVIVGTTIEGMVEVKDGLHEGDDIAADGAELLKGGASS